MPAPKQIGSAKPADMKVTVVKPRADWQQSSDGRHHIFLFDGTWNDSTGINPANNPLPAQPPQDPVSYQ